MLRQPHRRHARGSQGLTSSTATGHTPEAGRYGRQAGQQRTERVEWGSPPAPHSSKQVGHARTQPSRPLAAGRHATRLKLAVSPSLGSSPRVLLDHHRHPLGPIDHVSELHTKAWPFQSLGAECAGAPQPILGRPSISQAHVLSRRLGYEHRPEHGQRAHDCSPLPPGRHAQGSPEAAHQALVACSGFVSCPIWVL